VDHGVRQQLMAPYTPQQNGVVKRQNQTVVNMARTMLKSKPLPGILWGEAVTAAVYVLNESTTKGVADMTLFEAGGTPPKDVRVCRAHEEQQAAPQEA
jgi:transposase InsO family protein